MQSIENVNIALDSVRSNWLRAVLTLLIIAFGIMALVGILTAIDTAIYSLNNNLSSLGANSISIDPIRKSRQGGAVRKSGGPITYREGMDFKDRFDFPAQTSVSLNCTNTATIKYGGEKTNPNFLVFGVSENYLTAKGFELSAGRNFTERESLQGGNITIVGYDIVDQLFNGDPNKAVGRYINAGFAKLLVVGTLKTKGASMSQSEDRRILVPLLTGKRYFGTPETSYDILVAIDDPTRIEEGISEATGLFRIIRRLKAGEENDFEIEKSDGLIDVIKENTVNLRFAAVMVGLITLVGAAIGLMNIMLVSVTERTKEIGVRKALGATQQDIRRQFLTEAVVICQIGGLVGILLGVLVGNIVTFLLGGNFLFPWNWIILAIAFTTGVGLISGLYPAIKAARLDPIESLRYE